MQHLHPRLNLEILTTGGSVQCADSSSERAAVFELLKGQPRGNIEKGSPTIVQSLEWTCQIHFIWEENDLRTGRKPVH